MTMFGKKQPESEFAVRHEFPVPRMTRREHGLELVLRYVERILGHPLSSMDAEVLVALIEVAKDSETEDKEVLDEHEGENEAQFPESSR